MARGRSKEFLLNLRRKFRLGEFRCKPEAPRPTRTTSKPARQRQSRDEASLWES